MSAFMSIAVIWIAVIAAVLVWALVKFCAGMNDED